MGFKFNTLLRALIAGGVSTPPPPAPSIYGAPADAGENNTSDSITGTRYYLDATSGIDTNAGTEALPFQTLAKVYAYTVSGGAPAAADSAFMLKRGDTYNGFLVLKKLALNTSKYLTGAWGAGARPIVQYVHSAALNSPSIGIAKGTNGFTKIRNIQLDGKFVTQVHAGTVTGAAPTAGQTITGGTSGATGVFQYDSATYWTIALTGSAGTLLTYKNAEALTWPGGSTTVSGTPNMVDGVWFSAGGVGGWEVSNTDVYNCTSNGILLGYNNGAGTADNILIRGNTVRDACRAQGNGAGIDGGGCGTALGLQSSLIESNTVYDCGIAGYGTNHNMYIGNLYDTTIRLNWSYMTLNRGNHALVIHGVCDNVLIEKNLMEGCGNGIGINPGYAAAESLNGFTVRQNINRRHGRWSGQTQGYAALLAGITNSAIYNNLWYGNCFGFNLTLGGGSDSSTSNVTISHETFYNNTTGVKPTGNEAQVYIVGAVTGVVLQNSIIVNTGTSHYLLWVDTAALAGLTLRNCLLYSPNYSGKVIHWGASDYTLADWMTSFGNALGCKVGDPLFTNAAGDDFTLQAGSPAKLAGYNSGITTDFAGNARHATTPSIGAYE